MSSHGKLYVVATPIGNLEDMAPRAVQALQSAHCIAAEDTRHSAKLLKHFAIRTTVIAYHEHNEAAQAQRILGSLEAGRDVALISDAGTPLVSDPGYRLVRAAHQSGYAVVPVPGPSALCAALSAAGLPTDRFFFEGFLVARALGRDVAIREQLETAGKELNQQLRDMAQELKDQFDAERARLGADATQEEREQLARMGAEAQARVQQGQLAAQRKAQELQAQIARQFQDEVRPVAAQVAHERGAVVAIPTSFLLWADGGADITSAVIERMKSTQPPQ